MPIMIPNVIPDGASDSEKAIFETLRVAAEGRQWEVLHGPSVGSHRFDFVIFSPIDHSVICFNVVTDKSYQFENEKWSDTSGKTVSSPIDHAKASMKALRKHFETSHFHGGSPLSLGYAVAFPDGTKTEAWLLPEHLKSIAGGEEFPGLGLIMGNGNIGPDALHPNTLGLFLGEYAASLNHVTSYEISKKAQLMLNDLRTELVSTGETIATIATIFHDNLQTNRPQLLRLMKDQLKILQLAGCQLPSAISAESDNRIMSSDDIKEQPRVVVDGAAGTGKTVLAMEIARQRCEAGETVGLLCSNPYLSQHFEKWAETLFSDNGGKVIAGTPAKLPFWAFGENKRLKNEHQQRLDDSTDLEGSLKLGYLDNRWRQFIDETIEGLNTLAQKPVFDYLIVDEAQNLCDEMFLNLQNALLKDGLENGRWIMFGDFKNQQIVSPEINPDWTMLANYFVNQEIVSSEVDTNWKEVQKEVLRKIRIEYATLETNCRNTHEIADKTFKLVGIESPSMSGVYGPHVQIDYFESEKQLANLLDNLIRDWENRRFQSRQIILLSSGTGDEFDTSRNYSGWRLLNIAEEPSSGEDKTLKYSDVYDFQGLESDLAILVLPQTEDNVELADSFTLPREKHLRRVLYTGMSRAKAMLVIVANEGWEEILKRREILSDTLISLQKTK